MIRYGRIKFLVFLLVLAGIFLSGRLFRLQVTEGKKWGAQAVRQRGRVFTGIKSGGRSWTGSAVH